MTPTELHAALEAIIYAADEPATLDQIAKALGVEKAEARAGLDSLAATYSTEDRGIEVRKVAGGWKVYTKPQHHEAVRKFIKSLQPPLRLTMPALETLAVIAYKQPVTAPEINEIRGVNVGGTIKTLLEKHLITTAGRKEVIAPSEPEFLEAGAEAGDPSSISPEASPVSSEAAEILASGETNDLAELGEETPEEGTEPPRGAAASN